MTLWPICRFGVRRRAFEIVKALKQVDVAFDLKLVRRLAADLEQDLAKILRQGAFAELMVELTNSISPRSVHLQITEWGEVRDRTGQVVPSLSRLSNERRGRWTARLFVRLHPLVSPNEDRQRLRLDWRPRFSRQDFQHEPDRSSRRRLRVISVGHRGYAFGESVDAEPRLRKVFLHVRQAPPNFGFVVGQVVSAEIVQAQDGPQGRRIREV